jgi:hypothetical protein
MPEVMTYLTHTQCRDNSLAALAAIRLPQLVDLCKNEKYLCLLYSMNCSSPIALLLRRGLNHNNIFLRLVVSRKVVHKELRRVL